MKQQTEAQIEVARRLLAAEKPHDGSAHERAAAAFRVYDALLASLAPLIGAAGVAAAFARSVKLTGDELAAFRGPTDESDEASRDTSVRARALASLRTLEPDAASAAAELLLANFLGLLTSFIGEGLLSRVLRRAFPALDQTVAKETDG
jgi:hypothetical protein